MTESKGIPREELPGAPLVIGTSPFYWIEHRSSRSIKRVTHDGGKTWETVGVTWAAQRGAHELQAEEMARIQRDLK